MDVMYFVTADAGLLALSAATEIALRKRGEPIGYKSVRELSALLNETIKANDPKAITVLYRTALTMNEDLVTTDNLNRYFSGLAEELRNAETATEERLDYIWEFVTKLTKSISRSVNSGKKFSTGKSWRLNKYCREHSPAIS